jgi:hypothetical protein
VAGARGRIAVFFGCGRASRSLQGLTQSTTANQPRRRWTRSKHPDNISCERSRASRWARRAAGSARCAGAISVPAHSPRTASSARRRPASSTAASATASEPCLTAVPSPVARHLRPGRRSAQAHCNSVMRRAEEFRLGGRFKEEMPSGLRAVFVFQMTLAPARRFSRRKKGRDHAFRTRWHQDQGQRIEAQSDELRTHGGPRCAIGG